MDLFGGSPKTGGNIFGGANDDFSGIPAVPASGSIPNDLFARTSAPPMTTERARQIYNNAMRPTNSVPLQPTRQPTTNDRLDRLERKMDLILKALRHTKPVLTEQFKNKIKKLDNDLKETAAKLAEIKAEIAELLR
jgi:septal ring factor EnvC (AmiA/AmiB activator)